MKQFLRLFLPLLTALSLLTACGGTSPDTDNTPDYAVETLKLEGGTDWGAPNPFLSVSRGPGTAKMRLVFASLLEKDENGDVSWLAEQWSIDGQDYAFTLFENAVFHDGVPLTTADVAFSLDYFKEHPPVSNPLGIGEDYLVDHYTIVDERTIIISVKEPNADTLANLGSFVILPKHVWEARGGPQHLHRRGLFGGQRRLPMHRLRRGHRKLCVHRLSRLVQRTGRRRADSFRPGQRRAAGL